MGNPRAYTLPSFLPHTLNYAIFHHARLLLYRQSTAYTPLPKATIVFTMFSRFHVSILFFLLIRVRKLLTRALFRVSHQGLIRHITIPFQPKTEISV